MENEDKTESLFCKFIFLFYIIIDCKIVKNIISLSRNNWLSLLFYLIKLNNTPF